MNLFIFLWAICALIEWNMHTDIVEQLNIVQLFFVYIIVIIFSPFMIISDIALLLLDIIIGDDYNDD